MSEIKQLILDVGGEAIELPESRKGGYNAYREELPHRRQGGYELFFLNMNNRDRACCLQKRRPV